MFRFTIRDALWLTAVLAIGRGCWADRLARPRLRVLLMVAAVMFVLAAAERLQGGRPAPAGLQSLILRPLR